MSEKKEMKNTAYIVSKELLCASCGFPKRETEYYKSYNKIHTTGKIPYCKTCLKNMICEDDRKTVSLERLKVTLQLIDKPFLADYWKISLDKGGDIFGWYMKNLALTQNRQFTWEDSKEDLTEMKRKANYKILFNPADDFDITEEIVLKWGTGYKINEYDAFEKKYELLKNNYPEKTSMHTEALLKYIRYSVKEELATAANAVADAKSWGALAKDAATAAKINPSQLSASDLQDGLTTFGQLARAVETAVDIIPLLPKFKKKPQDSVDFTLWCYINYIRDLKGLPLCEYEEIYGFYEERKRQYDKTKEYKVINEKLSPEKEEGDDW